MRNEIDIIKTGSAFNAEFEFYKYSKGKIIRGITNNGKIHVSIIDGDNPPTDEDVRVIGDYFYKNKRFYHKRLCEKSCAVILHEE